MNKLILWFNGATMVFLLLLISAGSVGAAPPLPGAIFTTDSTGTIVNGNTKYGSKCGDTGVWLDGGPGPNAPQTAAGLPDGDYYFQVTDPSGKKLLSTDPVQDRCVTVEGGIITKNCDLPGPPGPGTHQLRASTDAGGGVVVELCPFDDTPNNGGVYKAWMTPVGDGTVEGGGFVGDPTQVDNSCGNGCFHGFVPARSKTDNFKVKDVRTFCIFIHKDIRDDKDDVVPGVGWEVWITDPIGGMTALYTGEDGSAEVCGLVPGFYDIEEHQQDGYTVVGTKVNGRAIAPSTSVSIQLKNGMKKDTASIEFLNEPCDKCDE
jgi:hypothetical protein